MIEREKKRQLEVHRWLTDTGRTYKAIYTCQIDNPASVAAWPWLLPHHHLRGCPRPIPNALGIHAHCHIPRSIGRVPYRTLGALRGIWRYARIVHEDIEAAVLCDSVVHSGVKLNSLRNVEPMEGSFGASPRDKLMSGYSSFGGVSRGRIEVGDDEVCTLARKVDTYGATNLGSIS